MSKIVINFLHDHDTRKHEVAKHAKMVLKNNNNFVIIDDNKKMQRIAMYFECGNEMQGLLPLGQMIRHMDTMQC
jgi:hypothetical protein